MSGINVDTEYSALITGSITAVSQTVDFISGNNQTEAVSILGTWVGTLQFEATINGTTWFAVNALNQATLTQVSSTATNGNFLTASQAYAATRIRASTWTSGSANIDNTGSDAVGLPYVFQGGSWIVTSNQGTPNTIANSWPVKITDGVDIANITSAQEITIADRVNNGGLDKIIIVTTSPIEGKVGASRLVNRKYVWMQGLSVGANPNAFIYWGFSSSTQSFKLFKDQILTFPIGEGTEVWFKAPTAGTFTVAFGEGA